MIDRLHGCYKDTSDSVQAAAICLGGIVMTLALGGIAMLLQAAARLWA